jgi:hypothetical protein
MNDSKEHKHHWVPLPGFSGAEGAVRCSICGATEQP